MEQKFKRGNLVKINENVKDIFPELVDRTAIIKGSYADLYGGHDINNYFLIWTDTGTSFAWKSDNELELVDEGGEHLFAEAKANRERILKVNTDLNYIVKNWKKIKYKQNSDTILFLFDKIAYKSPFLENGEYYTLLSSWVSLFPLFDAIMTVKVEQDKIDIFKERFFTYFSKEVADFFSEVQAIKT